MVLLVECHRLRPICCAIYIVLLSAKFPHDQQEDDEAARDEAVGLRWPITLLLWFDIAPPWF